ncbi:MAG: arylesterase [Hyphomicrobium sp.]
MKTKLARFSAIAAAAAFCVTCAMTSIAAAANEKPISIVAFGDSLTAGYQLPASKSFPAQLQMALEAKGHKVQVINAGVSGDTTANGLDRLEWSLEPKPDAVILELGANDALRGVDPKQTRANLDKLLAAIAAKGADVLLAGMKAPGNWGGDYQAAFDVIYPELAKAHNAALYPFFLEGVALNKSMTMPDGLHPTADGVAEIVTRILPSVEALVQRVAARKAAAN